MAITLYEFFDLTRENFSDYVSRYDIELSNFLSKFEDNTESLFIDYQKVYLKKMTQAIIQSINEIDSNDPDGEFVFDYLQKKLSTNRRILEFLDNRMNSTQNVIDIEQNGNISKSTSNDNKTDITSMSWFIVGKNIANGEIQKLVNNKLSNGKIAEELGLKYSDSPYISKSKLFRPCRGEKSRNNIFNYPEKIIEIYNHCINNGITVVPEFEEIALKHI